MRPNQTILLKNIAFVLGIIIAAYFIWFHPLFVFIIFLIVILLGILLIIYLPKISEFIEDLVDSLNKK
jgi:hypothetical protein